MENEEQKTRFCSLADALNVAIKLESIAPKYGYHVALTGGCLYKPGALRKDIDIVLYNINDEKQNRSGFEADLKKNFNVSTTFTNLWLTKIEYDNMRIDLFYSHIDHKDQGGEYARRNATKAAVDNFTVVCDSTNNSADDVTNHLLNVDIYFRK